MRQRMRTSLLVGLLLAAAACGDDDDADRAGTSAAIESTVTGSTTATTGAPAAVGQQLPAAIVSLSPTATEMLFAIGAGDQVLAVDDFSNYPPEASAKMPGISGYEPNIEAIAGLEPDLVITDGTNTEVLAQFDTLGIDHWEGPAAVTFDDIYTQLEQLGALTGHVDEAVELVAGMEADIAAVIDGLPDLPEPLTYYHELDPNGFWSVTGDTFIGRVYAEAGLVNIADEVGDGNPYPQLSAEFIVSADPDLIFLACTKYCNEGPESVAERDGWAGLRAVVNGNVIPMDDDVASRWGPRVVDYIEQVGAAIEQAATVPSG